MSNELQNVPRLEENLVTFIFERMEYRYGDEWARKYKNIDMLKMAKAWQIDLADLTLDEIKRGVAATKDEKYPPNCPRFREMCRPPIDYELAFFEAAKQLPRWHTGHDKWSNNAYFYAARSLGCDFFEYGYTKLSKRWKIAVDEAIKSIREGTIPNEIPKRPLAITDSPLSLEKRRENLKKISEMIKNVFKAMK